MRDDILTELDAEYKAQQARNEQDETARKDRIRREYPQIQKLTEERETLIFGTIHRILEGSHETDDLTDKMEKINREISQELKNNGFPENYLDPIYKCPVCRDTGYTGELIRTPCECFLKSYREKLQRQIGLGQKNSGTFESFDVNIIPDESVPGTGATQRQLSVFAREQCEKWADQYPETRYRDLLLSGGSGLGKTFLMQAMAARLIERGINVLLISAYTFLQMARKNHFEGNSGIKELLEVPVLMMDDLGSEPLMQNITVEQLFCLINERQNSGKSTVISTNLTLSEIRERYTERIASRLNNPRNCLILTLAGKDLRKIEK